MKNKIIAVVGLAGSGKTEVVEYLMSKTGWPKVYFGDATFDELQKRGLAVNEANERLVREQIRAEHGMAAYAVLNLPKIKKLHQTSNVILESLYSWEEYLTIKKEFGDDFEVIAIYASTKTRVDRLSKRPIRPLSAADLESRDQAQIVNLHQAGPIAKADYTIINEKSLKEFKQSLDSVINQIKK